MGGSPTVTSSAGEEEPYRNVTSILLIFICCQKNTKTPDTLKIKAVLHV